MGCNIASFEGENGELKKAILTDGSALDADICIVGIGTIPNTSYLIKAGIELDRNGNLEVNEVRLSDLNFPKRVNSSVCAKVEKATDLNIPKKKIYIFQQVTIVEKYVICK